ncbi:MAG: prepilin-type N-terminal cleavage/methylation domain-containing protein [Gammaproteobacteria bacterium]|jgi:prepilin-type N-terminal cleavage/methylation domain-containing protein|nr:prepilin-type N-terminal cleavage/methylation domain-containing protein [Gammaproteobacteria bacterium]
MLVRINKETGFTLIELAVVLFIVSLLLAGFLSPLSTRLEQQNRERTVDKLDEIKESLLGYAVINGRLPCPDCPDGNVGTCGSIAASLRNDGIEDRDGSTSNFCRTNIGTVSIGNMPWVDLQVREHDEWARHYTYGVTSNFADDVAGTGCGTVAVGISFEICSPGAINIHNTYVVGPTVYPTASIAGNIPAIVISHGNDGYEANQSAQQVENYGRKPVNPVNGIDILSSYTATAFSTNDFIYTDFTRDTSLNPPTQFDDLVIWLSPAILMNRMLVSGSLP